MRLFKKDVITNKMRRTVAIDVAIRDLLTERRENPSYGIPTWKEATPPRGVVLSPREEVRINRLIERRFIRLSEDS